MGREHQQLVQQPGTMIRTSSSGLSRFVLWCMLLLGPVLFGALGWWLAGPLLAVPLACLPIWRALRRWAVIDQGFRVDDDGFELIDQGSSLRRVRWAEFAAIDVERRVRPRAFPGLMRLGDAEVPLVPVVSLRDGEEWAVWPLAARSRVPGSEQGELGRVVGRLQWAHERWVLLNGPGGPAEPDAVRRDIGSATIVRRPLPPLSLLSRLLLRRPDDARTPLRNGEAEVLRSGARGSGRMIWNASTGFQRRLRWIVLLPLPIALGALGWWLAGPVLAALLASWPVWVAATRWKASERGVRIDDDGLCLIHRGVARYRVAWTDVTGIDVQRRIPEGDWEYLMRGPGRRLPLVPVLSLGTDRECVVWPLAVAQFEDSDRTEQAQETGLALLAEWERANGLTAHGAVRSG